METELEQSWINSKLKKQARKNQENRDLSKYQQIKILVRGHCTKTVCFLNEVTQYIMPKIDIPTEVKAYAKRSTLKREPWCHRHITTKNR